MTSKKKVYTLSVSNLRTQVHLPFGLESGWNEPSHYFKRVVSLTTGIRQTTMSSSINYYRLPARRAIKSGSYARIMRARRCSIFSVISQPAGGHCLWPVLALAAEQAVWLLILMGKQCSIVPV